MKDLRTVGIVVMSALSRIGVSDRIKTPEVGAKGQMKEIHHLNHFQLAIKSGGDSLVGKLGTGFGHCFNEDIKFCHLC